MSKFRAGQKCIVVQSEAGNLGKIVTLVRYVGDIEPYAYSRWWQIKESLKMSCGYPPTNHAYEAQLMPLESKSNIIMAIESVVNFARKLTKRAPDAGESGESQTLSTPEHSPDLEEVICIPPQRK